MPEKLYEFSAIQQLAELLKRYPEDKPENKLEIEGVILDYLGQSGETLDCIFQLNQSIYVDLFTGGNSAKGKHLLSCAVQSEDARQALAERCREIYPNIPKMLGEIAGSHRDNISLMGELIKDPSKYLSEIITSVAWHLSDIHFGKFNKLENNPRDLAYMLAKLAFDYPKLRPDVVIVSGDVSSVCANAELRQFVIFCEELQQAIWSGPFPQRILVVPGNHDVTWLSNGDADRMRNFKSIVADSQCCITPFGSSNDTFEGGNVVVQRLSPYRETTPPIADVVYKKHSLRFLLLVSGYFSGGVPDAVRALLNETALADDSLIKLLRIDEGGINREYLLNVSRLPEYHPLTSIAVVHHNPIQYGTEVCSNRFAPQLLETLWTKEIPLLLHGHTHQVDDPGSQRPAVPRSTYPVPSPTLCSITTGGSGRGLNILMFEEPAPTRRIETLLWTVSASSGFNPDGVVLRYRFKVNGKEVEVQHSL